MCYDTRILNKGIDMKNVKNVKDGATIVECIITIVALSIVAGIIGLIVLGVKGCNHIADKGIKNVATSVWEGSGDTDTNSLPTE